MVRFASFAAFAALLGVSLASPVMRQLIMPSPMVVEGTSGPPSVSASAYPTRTPGASFIPRESITVVAPGRTPGASALPSSDPTTSPMPPSAAPSGAIASPSLAVASAVVPSASVGPSVAAGTVPAASASVSAIVDAPASGTRAIASVAPASTAPTAPGPNAGSSPSAGVVPATPSTAATTSAAASTPAAAAAAASTTPGAETAPVNPDVGGSVTSSNTEISPSPEVTPSPEAPTPETAAAVCFPARATVELEDGSVKTMEQVELGDRVKVASGKFSDVFMFTHKLASVEHEFVSIKTNTGAELALTAGHYIYVNGDLVPAKVIKAGDALELGDGSVSNVVSVETVKGRGLFNPQTTHGDIIVDGVRASTYTTAVAPKAAHALLAPARSLYERLGLTSGYLDAGSARLAALVGQVISN